MAANQMSEILRLQHIMDGINLQLAEVDTKLNEIYLTREMDMKTRSHNPGGYVTNEKEHEADLTSTSKLDGEEMDYGKAIDLGLKAREELCDQMDEVVEELLKLKTNTYA